MAKAESSLLVRESTLRQAEERFQMEMDDARSALAIRERTIQMEIGDIGEGEEDISRTEPSGQDEEARDLAPYGRTREQAAQPQSAFQRHRASRLEAALRDNELATSGPRSGAPEAIKLAQEAFENVWKGVPPVAGTLRGGKVRAETLRFVN
jgi:hypothetical protein